MLLEQKFTYPQLVQLYLYNKSCRHPPEISASEKNEIRFDDHKCATLNQSNMTTLSL